ncbi:hypothetical protein ACFE04_002381 [Oxalis oulophora]
MKKYSSAISEFEGTLLKDPDPFSYYMLVAFEASGLFRFTFLLFMWPLIRLLEALGLQNIATKLMIFIATAGLHISEIESVSRAVLPKFYMDDIELDAWRVFSSYDKRVVVTKTPTIMVERFVKEHLRAHEVIGTQLILTRFGFATGFVKDDMASSIKKLFIDSEEAPTLLGLGKDTSIVSLCEKIMNPKTASINIKDPQLIRPLPVIFHDGRLVKRPTPSTAFMIILWIPLGIILAIIRIFIGVGFFHATTARGWKALDPIFFFMNPMPVYEVTFLNQLPVEATCTSGKSPHDVANYVQRILAATLGFECTNFTRKDKYRVLAGNDGTVSYTSFVDQIKKVTVPKATVGGAFTGGGVVGRRR